MDFHQIIFITVHVTLISTSDILGSISTIRWDVLHLKGSNSAALCSTFFTLVSKRQEWSRVPQQHKKAQHLKHRATQSTCVLWQYARPDACRTAYLERSKAAWPGTDDDKNWTNNMS